MLKPSNRSWTPQTERETKKWKKQKTKKLSRALENNNWPAGAVCVQGYMCCVCPPEEKNKKKLNRPRKSWEKEKMFLFFWLKSQLQHFNLRKIINKENICYKNDNFCSNEKTGLEKKNDCTVSPSNARVLLINSISTRYLFSFTFFYCRLSSCTHTFSLSTYLKNWYWREM